MASFLSAATVSILVILICLKKVVSDCLKCVPQKPVVTTCIGEPATQNPSDLLNKDIICMQDLDCTTLQNKLLETSQIETFSPAVGNRRNVLVAVKKIILKYQTSQKLLKTFPCITVRYGTVFRYQVELVSSFKDGDFGTCPLKLFRSWSHKSY